MGLAQSPWMTRQEAAEYLGVSVRTLSTWACTGGGPAYSLPRPRMARYHKDDLDQWLLASKRLHTADDGSAAAVLAEAHQLVRRPRR